jgi:hypothetical protein
MWNEHRTNFARPDMEDEQDPDSPILGHADALMALVYLWRMVKSSFQADPRPVEEPGPGQWRNPYAKQSEDGRPITSRPVKVTNYSDHVTGRIAPKRRRR